MISVSDIPVFVLVGGLGTRLRAVVTDVPKPLAPIAGKPFLEWQIEALKAQGFRAFVFLTGYRADAIAAHFGDGDAFGVECAYSVEDRPLGTGGALKLAFANHPEYRSALVLNGDSFVVMDYAALIRRADPRLSTLALHYQEDLSRFGRVQLDQDGRITTFASDTADTHGGLINAGGYHLHRDLLCATDADAFSLEQDVFPTAAREGLLKGFIATGPFIDIGIPASFEEAQTVIPRWAEEVRRPCLFLDRDGVIIDHVPYLHRPDQVRLIPATLEVIGAARAAGWRVVVITNQAGVGRGKFTIEDCRAVHDRIDRELAAQGLAVDAWYCCYYHPEAGVGPWRKQSFDRKPQPGMVLKACDDFPIDVTQSLFVGDNLTDQIQLDGLETWLVKGDFDLTGADRGTTVFDTHAEAADAFRRRLSAQVTGHAHYLRGRPTQPGQDAAGPGRRP